MTNASPLTSLQATTQIQNFQIRYKLNVSSTGKKSSPQIGWIVSNPLALLRINTMCNGCRCTTDLLRTKKHNSTRVPSNCKVDQQLGKLVQKQRKYCIDGKLSAKRIELLETIHFSWWLRAYLKILNMMKRYFVSFPRAIFGLNDLRVKYLLLDK